MAKLKNEAETDADILLCLQSVVSAARFKEIEDLPVSWLAELFKDELHLGRQGKELRFLHYNFTNILNDPDFIISDEIFTIGIDPKIHGALKRCNNLIFQSNRSHFANNLGRLGLKLSTFRPVSHSDALQVCWIMTSKALMIKDLLVGSYGLYSDYEILTMAYEKYIYPTVKPKEKVWEQI